MSKILVAYFSASGVTEGVAKTIAQALDGDLFKINPLNPYSKADLNWMDKNSRSSVEMKDRACRPEIADKKDISSYDTVYIGFPIWWYREPSIIDTFIESYDFSDKTIIPFCTSGGSALGEAPMNIQRLAPNAKVLSGKRLSPSVSTVEIQKLRDGKNY